MGRIAWLGVVALAAACGGSGAAIDASATPVIDAIPHTPGEPGVGAHALAFYRYGGQHAPTLSTPAMTTAAGGSTMIVSTGRGDLGAMALPTDSHANAPYQQLGTAHAYTNWAGSGTAVYAFPAMAGGADHVVTVTTPVLDELTLMAVEVVDGTEVTAAEWDEVLAPAALTSPAVTTSGPATLVAFWWGDAGVEDDKTAVPDNGFTVVDSILEEGALVQGAVAVKVVAEAGTYDVTWAATPVQGAQLWLIAVE